MDEFDDGKSTKGSFTAYALYWTELQFANSSVTEMEWMEWVGMHALKTKRHS